MNQSIKAGRGSSAVGASIGTGAESRVVVIVDGGVVQEVLTASRGVQCLVLDRDDPAGASQVRAAVGTAALDAMAQALPKVAKDSVNRAYASIEAALTDAKFQNDEQAARVLSYLRQPGDRQPDGQATSADGFALSNAGQNPGEFSIALDFDSAGAGYGELAVSIRKDGKAVGFVVVGLGGQNLEPVVHVSTGGDPDEFTHQVFPLRERNSAVETASAHPRRSVDVSGSAVSADAVRKDVVSDVVEDVRTRAREFGFSYAGHNQARRLALDSAEALQVELTAAELEAAGKALS